MNLEPSNLERKRAITEEGYFGGVGINAATRRAQTEGQRSGSIAECLVIEA